jgi:hypothetical protein
MKSKTTYDYLGRVEHSALYEHAIYLVSNIEVGYKVGYNNEKKYEGWHPAKPDLRLEFYPMSLFDFYGIEYIEYGKEIVLGDSLD